MRFHLSRAATVAECTPRTRKDDQLVRRSPAQLLIYAKLPARRLWVQANYCAIRGMLAQDVQHAPGCQVRSSLLKPNNAVRGHIQERRSAHAEYLKTVCVHRRTIRSAENSTWPGLSLSQNGYGDNARMSSSYDEPCLLRSERLRRSRSAKPSKLLRTGLGNAELQASADNESVSPMCPIYRIEEIA